MSQSHLVEKPLDRGDVARIAGRRYRPVAVRMRRGIVYADRADRQAPVPRTPAYLAGQGRYYQVQNVVAGHRCVNIKKIRAGAVSQCRTFRPVENNPSEDPDDLFHGRHPFR